MIENGTPGAGEDELAAAVRAVQDAATVAALTGAGISVESGVPDFRSPGGVWTIFSPEEYATLEVFRRDPAKAWKLYRALGKSLGGSVAPNAAHRALARLEAAGRLDVLVTQNVDGLHQAAGSRRVIEVHGDHQHVHCPACGWVGPFLPEYLEDGAVPACRDCGRPVKPNVVLFGEEVRGMDEAVAHLEECDALLVVGTSAQVYPAAGLPALVQARGGLVLEFNIEEPAARGPAWLRPVAADFFFGGPATRTVPRLVDAVLSAG